METEGRPFTVMARPFRTLFFLPEPTNVEARRRGIYIRLDSDSGFKGRKAGALRVFSKAQPDDRLTMNKSQTTTYLLGGTLRTPRSFTGIPGREELYFWFVSFLSVRYNLCNNAS